MSTSINWADPVLGPDANTMSKAYLARLQAFLESQSPGTGSSSSSSGTTDSNKRKNPSTENEIDAAASIKDRKQATATSTHSHTKEGSSERESPEEEDRKGSGRGSKANSTTDKRKEQNRNAQRAFRERKEKVLRDLEDKVSELKEANETTLNENQNLKELVTRLQQENAQLKKAPQSDFTFSMPTANNASSATPDRGHTHGNAGSSSMSTSAHADSGASSNNAPHSYSNEDILAFLASAPTVQPSQPAFTMIEPSNVNSGNSGQGSDSWMFEWNSSAFGTELPQAVPPQVTNLALQPTVDNSFATLWNSLNQQQQQQQQGPSQQFNNPISTSPVNPLGQGNMPTPPRSQDNNNSAFFSLFQNAFTDPSSSHYTNASSAPNNAHYSGNSNSASNLSASNGMPSQSMNSSSSAISPASMHNGNNGRRSQSVSSSAVGTNSVPNAQLTRMTSNSTAESPASISSTSDSCPSEAQPGTPSNGASLFAAANGKAPSHTNSLDSASSSFLNFAMPAGFTNFYGSQTDAGYKQGYPNAGNSSDFESMFGGSNATDFTSVTTPSGVFDAMNYRDPLLAGTGSAGDDSLNFASMVANGSNGNFSTGNAPKKNGDVLDFNDFLVASPPSFAQSPPITTGHQERTASGLAKPESRSSSSVPTLGSCSSGTSPMSNQASPYMNASASYANSAGNVSNTGTPDWLPWDIASDHPLIAHVMKVAPSEEEREAANKRLALRGLSPTNHEVDSLCNDMMLKATCKEAARDRIAKAMQTDEITMRLYSEYLQSKAGESQK